MPSATASESTRRSVWRWFDDRLGIGGLRYPVPDHANSLAYTLGGVTLVSFVLLVVTGVYLAQFYNPDPGAAHVSVTYIIDEAFAGTLIRSLHYWLAAMFVGSLVLHMIRAFATASYKAPREMTWITGVILFVLGGGLLFTGTILKADQEAIEALEHNNEIADFFGVVGFWFSPDFTESVAANLRFYVAHVSILPVILFIVLAVHMLLIKRHRISPLPWGDAEAVALREREEHTQPFTSHLAHIGAWSLVTLGVALLLSGLLPTGLGPAGVEGIEITKPPWYFLWLYPLENWFGLWPLWAAPAILIGALLAVPFLDRSSERDPRRRRFWMVVAAIVIIGWIVLTIYGAVTVPVEHVGE